MIDMQYTNPVIRGFYPDPSVVYAEGKFYLVTSSFQYFPGVPLFESEDLVNWKQIGHVLTRKSQVELEGVRSSGGVFAPTIRYNNGRFYMVTNNNSTFKNFYVYTDDIYGEWSDPIEVERDGIDPSLLFDDDKCYFVSNGTDENGKNGVFQVEIDIETGATIGDAVCIWHGSGGRYIESPHVYRIGDYYYLMVAEGGTEYGHMVTYARSEHVMGPYEPYAMNPVLTNRNKAPYIIQGIGHGDLVQKPDGEWYMVSLGFRQIGEWEPFHNLGREVYLTPVSFDDKGWFTCGTDGTTDESYEIPGDFEQRLTNEYTFENTDFNIDWAYMRFPDKTNYKTDFEPGSNKIVLYGSDKTLDDTASPTFIALRQKDLNMECTVRIKLEGSDKNGIIDGVSKEAGITLYMCENEHYEIAVRKKGFIRTVALKLNIGGIKHIQEEIPFFGDEAILKISADNLNYSFSCASSNSPDSFIELGTAMTKYLSSEVSSGFTGTMVGLYATGAVKATIRDFRCKYL